jgi:cytochrome b involved in lipid metabolism
MLMIKLIHSSLGYVIILSAQLTALFGGYKYAEMSGIPMYETIAVQVFTLFFATLLSLEISYRLKLETYVPFSDEQKPIITTEEFEERVKKGENLVFLDDLVLNVSGYKWEHPGGSFVFDLNKGRDVSKYFYGGYSLEGGVRPYTHSNVARSIVNSLIVGRLNDTAEVSTATLMQTKAVS